MNHINHVFTFVSKSMWFVIWPSLLVQLQNLIDAEPAISASENVSAIPLMSEVQSKHPMTFKGFLTCNWDNIRNC